MSERSDEAETSIDDLLGHEEEAAPQPAKVRTGFGWWIRTLLMAAAFAAVAVLGLRMLDLDLPIPLAYGGCLALLVLRRVVAIVAAPPQPRGRAARAAATFGGIADPAAEHDGLRVAVNRWEKRLSWSESDRERFRTSVRPLIAELAAERLRQRHGVNMATDPQRARALLGDPLWTFLTTPGKRPPAQRDLAASVSHLEKL